MATSYINLPSADEQITESASNLLGKIVQRAGKKYIYATAAASLTAAVPYVVKYTGTNDPTVGAAVDGAFYNLVAVPSRALSTGDKDWFQIQGSCVITVPSATYVAARGLKIHDAAVTEMGAAHTNSVNEFAVIITGGTTVTSITVYLQGREALGTT